MSIGFKIFSAIDENNDGIFSDSEFVSCDNYFDRDVCIISKVEAVRYKSSGENTYSNRYIELEGGWILKDSPHNVIKSVKEGDTVKLSGKICYICIGNIRVVIIDGDAMIIPPQFID